MRSAFRLRSGTELVQGILVETKEDNLFEWKCAIKAAVSFKMIAPSLCAFIFLKSDSPYKNGTFHFTLSLPQNFPFKAPTVTIQTRELHSADKETKVTFTTKIYHPGINEEGSICVPVLRDEASAFPSAAETINVSTVEAFCHTVVWSVQNLSVRATSSCISFSAGHHTGEAQ